GLRPLAALRAHLRAVVRGRDDHGHAAGDVLEHRARELLALLVRQRELLGEVGEDAQAVGARGDHEIEAALLAFDIERPVLAEDGGDDREHAAKTWLISRLAGRVLHSTIRNWSRYSVLSDRPRPGFLSSSWR